MTIQWITEAPDTRPGSGLNTKIFAGGKAHLVYVVNNQLTYAIGSPGQLFVILIGGGPVASQVYQWIRHDNVLPSLQGNAVIQFDLALDSRGRTHLCFQGMQDQMTLGGVRHAVWDGSHFVPSPDVLCKPAPSTRGSGVAMAIAKDDAVHIAFFDSEWLGLRYATRAHDSDPFQIEDIDLLAGPYSSPSIAVGSGGEIGISYIVGTAWPHYALKYAEKMPSGWVTDTADPDTVPPMASTSPQLITNSLVIDANGVPHIAFFSGASGGPGIRHATWTTAGRSFWAIKIGRAHV